MTSVNLVELARLLGRLHGAIVSGGLARYSVNRLVADATALDDALTATDPGRRGRLAAVLVGLYAHLQTRLRAAPLDRDGLPELPGLSWNPYSPLAGLIEDIPPFGRIDIWTASLGGRSVPRPGRPRRAGRGRSRAPGPTTGRTLLGPVYHVPNPILILPTRVEDMGPLDDETVERGSSPLMRLLADAASDERSRLAAQDPLLTGLSDGNVMVADAVRRANAWAVTEYTRTAHGASATAAALIEHYSLGSGNPLTLTEEQMRDCRPEFNLAASNDATAEFHRLLDQLTREGRDRIAAGGVVDERLAVVQDVSFTALGRAAAPGTLGVFTGRFWGTLTVRLDPQGGVRHWEFAGTMDWYDQWDFEEHEAGHSSRTETGATRTAIAHHTLIGRPFRVGSARVPAAQTRDERRLRIGNPPWGQTHNLGLP